MLTIKCVKVGDDHYVGVTTLGDIGTQCLNPMVVAKSTERQRADNVQLLEAWRQRSDLQRKFNKGRVQRSVDYGHHIAGLRAGLRAGTCPPVDLWTDENALFDAATGTLTIPYDAAITAYDGETQYAARWMLAYGFDEEGYERPIAGNKAWLSIPFSITMRTNWDKESAMQSLHDKNRYSVPVSETDTASLNRDGALTKAVNAGITASGLASKLVKDRGTVTSKGSQPTSMLALLYGALGILYEGEVLEKSSPASWLTIGNKPHTKLGKKDQCIAAFVGEVLKLPFDEMRDLTLDHMLALGVHYVTTGQFKPLPTAEVEKIWERVKQKNGGKRVTIRASANALYEGLCRQSAMATAAA